MKIKDNHGGQDNPEEGLSPYSPLPGRLHTQNQDFFNRPDKRGQGGCFSCREGRALYPNPSSMKTTPSTGGSA